MNIKYCLGVLFVIIGISCHASVPVEVMSGNAKTSLDIMFFKYFKSIHQDSLNKNSPWLFFNRNRAVIDYKMTDTSKLPQFGFTEAISFNDKKLKGFAPVAVIQLLNSGVYPKAGIQFVHINHQMVFFSWLVCETKSKPQLDYFALWRFTPLITKKMHGYTQVEIVNSFPTNQAGNFGFTQRIRLGMQLSAFQFGVAADFSQIGKTNFNTTFNTGGFLRYDF